MVNSFHRRDEAETRPTVSSGWPLEMKGRVALVAVVVIAAGVWLWISLCWRTESPDAAAGSHDAGVARSRQPAASPPFAGGGKVNSPGVNSREPGPPAPDRPSSSIPGVTISHASATAVVVDVSKLPPATELDAFAPAQAAPFMQAPPPPCTPERLPPGSAEPLQSDKPSPPQRP